jgi:hypothetical protein
MALHMQGALEDLMYTKAIWLASRV